MLCNVCKKKEATVHLTQMLEGQIKKVDMCEPCAQKQGVDDPSGISLVDLLVGLGGGKETMKQDEGAAMDACPDCGYTQADLKKSGRLGCPTCYEAFEELLMPMLRPMHKDIRHKGKIPKDFHDTRELEAKAKVLERELQEAIKDERYEDAAVIRDSLKAITDSLKQVVTESTAP